MVRAIPIIVIEKPLQQAQENGVGLFRARLFVAVRAGSIFQRAVEKKRIGQGCWLEWKEKEQGIVGVD